MYALFFLQNIKIDKKNWSNFFVLIFICLYKYNWHRNMHELEFKY